MTAFNISKQWCINAAKQEELLNELTREETIADVKRLREALLDYHYAQKRMLEKWADGDANVKKDLWKLLHSCEDKGYEALAATDRPEYKDG